MPPKRPVGRGRGRGRGGAAAAARNNPQVKDEPESANEPAVSTPPAEHSTALSTSTPTAQQQEDVLLDPFPDISPASAPTETPAPTPAREAAKSLESLGALGRDVLGIGRGRGLGFGGRVMSTKFKPKAVQRRAADEREKAEKEEQARLREREEAAQRQAGLGRGSAQHRNYSRGSWMRGRARGRGDAMGRGRPDRNDQLLSEASGLFGIAPAAGVKKPGQVASSGTNRGGASGGRGVGTSSGGVTISRSATTTNASGSSGATGIKQEPGVLSLSTAGGVIGATAGIKVEFPEPIYPEDQEEGKNPPPKVNIECINLVSDDEEDDSDVVDWMGSKGMGRGSSNTSGIKPVRVERHEHRDRITLVNTEPAAATLTEDTKDFYQHRVDKGVEGRLVNSVHAQNQKTWSGVWRDDIDIKADPGQPADAVHVESNQDTVAQGGNVELLHEQTADEEQNTQSVPRTNKGKSTTLRKNRKMVPVFQTQEDREEYERHVEDVRILAAELGGVQRPTVSLDPDGTFKMDEEMADEPVAKDKNGRLYLFQFPPILPPLRHRMKEEDDATGDVEMMEVDSGPSAPAPAVDLTAPDTEEAIIIKNEPGVGFDTRPDLVTEEGFVGKLVVRKSGKISLDWGGTKMQLGRGAESEFLTTTLIADPPGEEIVDIFMGMRFRRGTDKPTGKGCGMGRIMGKFIVTPDFGDMID